MCTLYVQDRHPVFLTHCLFLNLVVFPDSVISSQLTTDPILWNYWARDQSCLANRTGFPKLQHKPRELHAVTLNMARSSRPSHSTLKTSICSARAAGAGSPVLTPSWAPSGSSLFSCSSWTRERPGRCLFHNITLPAQTASTWPQQPLLPSGVWLWHKGTLIL